MANLVGGVTYRRWAPGAEIDAPLRLYSCSVDSFWIDYNGHMTEASYLTVFGNASDALFRYVGIDEQYRALGRSFYTVETHINYYREVGLDERLEVATQLLDLDSKRLHLFHTMRRAGAGDLLATTEQMLVHVDMRASRASAISPDVYVALEEIMGVHELLPLPEQMGRQMRIPA
jgi:acyl-CoA thioesterase FadM